MSVILLDRKSAATLPEGLYWDKALRGFGLKIRADASGSIRRSWIVQYRVKDSTKQRKRRIGDTLHYTFDQARKEALSWLGDAAKGIDQAAEKDADRASSSVTLRSVIDQYLKSKERSVQEGNHRAGSLRITRLYLTGTYLKLLHSTAINSITRAHIATRLNAISVDHSSNTANRVRAHLAAFFSWAMREGIAEANPVLGTNKPAGSKPRDRVLTDDELKAVWNACGQDEFGKIVRLLILTACRKSEIGGMRWSEIDLKAGTLTIPGTRTKNKRKHVVPLSDAALSIVESVPQMVNRDPLFGTRAEGFTNWPHVQLKDGCAHWTLHDLRRTCATGMADIGVHPHIIEAILNHYSGHKAGDAGTYNRATYEPEKRKALVLWADHVESIISGTARKVVALRA